MFISNPARDGNHGVEPVSDAQQSDALKKLIWFIVALAVLGTILALAWYFMVDLPVQQAAALHVPLNFDPDQVK